MEILDKDILGYKVKDISKVVIGTYIGYNVLTYAYWKYKNSQTKAKGRRALEARNA